jgi:hypothetical protein
LYPGVGPRGKLPDLAGCNSSGNVESTQDVELVLEDGEATGHDVGHARRPWSSNWADRVGDRVVTEHPTRSDSRSRCRAAHAIDVRCPGVSEHATSHVVDLVVSVSSCLGRPSVSRRIIFKRMSEIAAGSVGTASAHPIKLPVGREVDTNHTHSDTREVWTSSPARRATGCSCRSRGRRGTATACGYVVHAQAWCQCRLIARERREHIQIFLDATNCARQAVVAGRPVDHRQRIRAFGQ